MSTESDQNRGENTPKMWAIEIGLYPGILFGARTYKNRARYYTCILFTFCRYSFDN
jgi:hypothetical protein